MLYLEVLQEFLYHNGMATISTKGQITVPKALREKLGLRPGTRLEFHVEEGKLVAQKVLEKDPFQNWVGRAKSRFRETTDEMVNEMRGGPPERWVRKHAQERRKA
ncbi:AbrB/MazE/SpoVT family DNA-binding domain-containing protein [Acidobacteria bacterium AH-259-D05]|nr:AbrB/MazE/SpoVT family DNA-binding domain-containing protein [Acidobacteria bacterium AH-259-D05]